MKSKRVRKTLVLVFILAVVSGCNKESDPGTEAQTESTPESKTEKNTSLQARLRQPFSKATISDLPDQILPDKTIAGQSVGRLYEKVVALWDKTPLQTAEGKPLAYSATLKTELGSMEIELLPEVAPNHVRNFIALARVGYFDGLIFERTIHEQSVADPSHMVELVEGGCPLGRGGLGYGSIGYWLHPEFSDTVKHGEGMVGACRGEYLESAACRFYITLNPTPILDGERTIFGKIKHGLDVARRISTQPVLNAPEFPEGTRPEKPIVIRSVTIHCKTKEN